MRFSVGPLCKRDRYVHECRSLNTAPVPCWTKFRTSMQSEIWCSVFIQVQVPTITKSGSGHSIFFRNQSSGNHAVRNWMFWSGNNRIVRSQVDFSDNHAVRNLEAHFLFMSRFLTNMQSGISTWVLLKRTHNFRFSGTCGVWLPWVVSLQGGRHLYRLIQAASMFLLPEGWKPYFQFLKTLGLKNKS